MTDCLQSSETLAAGLAAIALVFSLATFALNYQHERRNAVLARKPVLIFVYDGKIGWTVRNVGNGPALNVVVAQKEEKREWFHPVRVPPLARDGKFTLEWLGHVNTSSLAATYEDTEGTPYTTTCSKDQNRPHEGWRVGPWLDSNIIAWWEAHLH